MAENIAASVSSTCLDSVFFNGETNDLTITFAQSGASYTYSGVPADVAQGLVEAPSKGRYFNQAIKGAYSYRKG